jgi:hypothetical protein
VALLVRQSEEGLRFAGGAYFALKGPSAGLPTRSVGPPQRRPRASVKSISTSRSKFEDVATDSLLVV